MKCYAIFSLLLLGLAGSQAATNKPTCGGSSSSKQVFLKTPTNPPTQCDYHIKAYSSYVCQLRIDFAMTLAQPSILRDQISGLTYAECQKDIFKVNNLKLCGVETAQHIYVSFNSSAGVNLVDLSFTIANRAGAGSSLPTASWDMIVTQLECPAGSSIRSSSIDIDEAPVATLPEARVSKQDGFMVAPPGCLQYFPNSYGIVNSFNLNNGRGIYPAKMNYAICFRRDTRTAGLQLKSTFFHMGGELNTPTSIETDNSCFRSDRTDVPGVDYLMIPQGSLWEQDRRATYFCGNSARSVNIRSTTPGPLVVIFNSDGIYGQNEAGFSFNYNIL